MCILVCVCVCKRGKKLSGRLAETNTMTMWCTAVISLWNTGREANQGLFIIRCSSWSTTYCGHTWRHNCVQAGLVCKELLASVATQLAHSTVNLISDLAVLSQQNKAQRRKHSIYTVSAQTKASYLMLLVADSVGARLTQSSNSFGSARVGSSFSILKALMAGRSQRYVGTHIGGFVSFWR